MRVRIQNELIKENDRLKCEVNEDSEHPGQHSSDEGFSNHVQELLDQLQKHQQEITRLRNEGGQERDKLKEQLQSVQDERDLYKSKVMQEAMRNNYATLSASMGLLLVNAGPLIGTN